MVFVKPEQRVGDEKGLHLRAADVEGARAPFAVLLPVGALIFVQRPAVEFVQPVRILGKMRGYPVENHAEAARVHRIDEVHKILRRAEARGRRVIAADLIAPRAVEGVLGHRHQFNVRIPHIGGIGAQLVGQFPVGEIRPVRTALPRAEVHLVNVDGQRRHRVVFRTIAAAAFHVRAVPPFVAVQRTIDRGCFVSRLGAERVRVGLIAAHAAPLNKEFVFAALAEARLRQRRRPDPARLLFHRCIVAPAVEVARQENGVGVRRPHAEHIPAPAQAVRAQIGIRAVIRTLMEKVFGKLILRFLHVHASRG